MYYVRNRYYQTAPTPKEAKTDVQENVGMRWHATNNKQYECRVTFERQDGIHSCETVE